MITGSISCPQETLRTALAMGADRAIHVEVPAKVGDYSLYYSEFFLNSFPF